MFKKSKIQIEPNESGAIIRASKSEGTSFVRLSQSSISLNPSTNWIKSINLSCIVIGPTDLIEKSFAHLTSLPGQLVIRESFTPSNSDDLDMDIKRAGSDDAPICIGLAPNGTNQNIYRKVIFDPTSTLKDTLIPHTNVDEIRAFHNDEEFVPADTTVSEEQA
mgnify:FL=1